MNDCIFCKIVRGEIPSQKLYEDDDLIVIRDIEPKAKLHYLCIPKEHFALLSEMDEGKAELLKRCFQKNFRPAKAARPGGRLSHHRQSGRKRGADGASSAHSYFGRRALNGILIV